MAMKILVVICCLTFVAVSSNRLISLPPLPPPLIMGAVFNMTEKLRSLNITSDCNLTTTMSICNATAGMTNMSIMAMVKNMTIPTNGSGTPRMMKLCWAKHIFGVCMQTVKRLCNVSSSSDPFPTLKFCMKNGPNISLAYIRDFVGSNYDSCTKSGNGMGVMNAFKQMSTKIDMELNGVSNEDMKGTTKTQQEKARAACAIQRGLINFGKKLFRCAGNTGCNDKAQKQMLSVSVMGFPARMKDICKLDDLPSTDVATSKGKSTDKKRQTIAYYGASYIDAFNFSQTIVCESFTANTNVTLLAHDKLELIAEIDRIDVTKTNATYLKALYVNFKDSKCRTVDFLNFMAGDAGKMNPKFRGGGKSIKDGQKPGGGKMDGGVTMKTFAAGKATKIKDKNSGSYIVLRKYYNNGSTGVKKPIYSVLIRISQKILNESTGVLVEGCTNPKDIGNGVTRKKRATTNPLLNHLVTATGDPNVGSILTDIANDKTSAVMEDSSFNTGSQATGSATLLTLLTILIWTLL